MHLFSTMSSIALVVLAVGRPQLAAAEKTARDLFPATTVAYAEISQPTRLLASVLDHPLRGRIESLDAVKQGLKSKQYQQLLLVVGLVEFQVGMPWKETVSALTEGGIYAGLDAESQGVAVLFKARDEKTLEKVVNVFLKMARDDAKNKQRPDRIEEHSYRGVSAYKIDDGIVARMGNWLLLSNKGELAKKIADRYMDDGASDCLGENPQFKAARQAIDGQAIDGQVSSWAFVDTTALREKGIAKKLFQEKSDNPLAELLLGGVLATARKTPYATATLDLNDKRLAVAIQSPANPEWIPESREFFFGQDSDGVAPIPLRPSETLFSVEAFRDVSAWWLAKEELFEEEIVAKLSQADSQFSTIFSGLDFGEEVLGSLKAPMQIVVTRQNFAELTTPQPEIRLPAGALIVEFKDPAKMARRLKVAYQSVIGFMNINLAQKGLPPLDIETEQRGEAKLVSASYLPEEGREGLINYNFSPSIAFVGDRLIISSTRELAIELAELAGKNEGDAQSSKLNTHVSLDVAVLKQTLEDNRDQLVARNALEKGHSKQQAEREIGILLELLDAADDLSLRLALDGEQMVLGLDLQFAGLDE